jgi:hypothetical protein
LKKIAKRIKIIAMNMKEVKKIIAEAFEREEKAKVDTQVANR